MVRQGVRGRETVCVCVCECEYSFSLLALEKEGSTASLQYSEEEELIWICTSVTHKLWRVLPVIWRIQVCAVNVTINVANKLCP